MNEDPIRNAARKARRTSRVPPGTACPCGESDPTVLVKVGRTTLDFHHIAGEAKDPELGMFLCPTCHRRRQIELERAGVNLTRRPRNLLEVIAAVLTGVGQTLKAVGEHLLAYAEQLWAFIVALDADCPQWRALPEAQL